MIKQIIKETERGKVGLLVSGFIRTPEPGTLEGSGQTPSLSSGNTILNAYKCYYETAETRP